MASEQYERLLGRLWAAKGTYREVPVPVLRKGMESMSFPVADDIEVEPVEVASCPAEWVNAPGTDRGRAVLYLHGGGYAMGSLETHRKLAGDISRAAGVPVLLIDYPLAPEHPYPAAVETSVAVFEALAAELGPASVAVAGDSAGGGLTMACVLALRDRGRDLPAGAAVLSPWVDLVDCDHTASPLAAIDPVVHAEGLIRMRDMYAGDADPADPLLSPARADLGGFPPLLIQVGEAEVLLPEAQRLAEAAQAAGVDVTLDQWPEMPHVWQVFAGRVPEATRAVEGIGRFVAQRLGSSGPAGGR